MKQPLMEECGGGVRETRQNLVVIPVLGRVRILAGQVLQIVTEAAVH